MLQHHTFLRCSRRTATVTITAIFLLFAIIGCASILRKAGLSPNEADRQSAIAQAALTDAAAEAVADIQKGIAQGKDIKTVAIQTGSAFAWKLATILASTAGVVLSGLLAKWLGTEKKINTALITAIEKTNDKTIKQSAKLEASLSNVQPQLHARVKALT